MKFWFIIMSVVSLSIASYVRWHAKKPATAEDFVVSKPTQNMTEETRKSLATGIDPLRIVGAIKNSQETEPKKQQITNPQTSTEPLRFSATGRQIGLEVTGSQTVKRTQTRRDLFFEKLSFIMGSLYQTEKEGYILGEMSSRGMVVEVDEKHAQIKDELGLPIVVRFYRGEKPQTTETEHPSMKSVATPTGAYTIAQ